MRAPALSLLAGAAALVVAGSASAVAPIPVGPGSGTALSATLSTAKAGAQPVVLTLTLRDELVCGQVGPAVMVVQLPAAAALPAPLSTRAVLVNGRTPVKVSVAARRVTLMPGRRAGVTCFVVAPGKITLRFTSSARLGNPRSPGTYSISVLRGKKTFRTTVRISA